MTWAGMGRRYWAKARYRDRRRCWDCANRFAVLIGLEPPEDRPATHRVKIRNDVQVYLGQNVVIGLRLTLHLCQEHATGRVARAAKRRGLGHTDSTVAAYRFRSVPVQKNKA